jgi:predicted RNA-binding Zn-ribbon protein involved in translation (DUF1610 family)
MRYASRVRDFRPRRPGVPACCKVAALFSGNYFHTSQRKDAWRPLARPRIWWYIDHPMSRVRERTRSWVTARVCLGCGYDGSELQTQDESATFLCPCCGQDLYARPPKSYAEMEGLVESAPSLPCDEIGSDACDVDPEAAIASLWWRGWWRGLLGAISRLRRFRSIETARCVRAAARADDPAHGGSGSARRA